MYIVPVHWFSVLLGVVVYMLIQALWYSPMLFQKVWMKNENYSESDRPEIKNLFFRKLPLILFCTIVLSYVLNISLENIVIPSLFQCVKTTFVLWFGLIFATSAMDYFYSLKKRPIAVYALTAGANFLGILGIVIAFYFLG